RSAHCLHSLAPPAPEDSAIISLLVPFPPPPLNQRSRTTHGLHVLNCASNILIILPSNIKL
ncbi:hypothetical protein BGY98DRAFT_1020485, partial [Russula aff. rugulosa BPL654]